MGECLKRIDVTTKDMPDGSLGCFAHIVTAEPLAPI
jgi:hypothetical protein